MQTLVSDTIAVRIVHLGDSTGKLQVIFADTDVLDLSAIARITKRRLEPTSLFNEKGDPFTRSIKIPTLIDRNILSKEKVSILYDSQSDFIELSTEEFEGLFVTQPYSYDSFTIPPHTIPPIHSHHASDEEYLSEALGRFQSIRLKQRLEETLELPPLPVSAKKIITLCSRKNVDTDELCDVISLDPSLAAQVVSWASSPYYGAPGDIESVEDAIIRVLGFDMVMNLALGLSMKNVLDLPKNGPRHYQNFWYNAVFRSSLMESLVKRMPAKKRPRIGHAYLAGLLHNFGYLVIGHVMPTHFSVLSRHLEANAHVPTELIEMHLLRFTKEQLGSWLLRHWGLPENICNSIRYAKSPQIKKDGELNTIISLLRCCHCLCHEQTIDKDLFNIIGLSEEECLSVYQEVQSSSSKLQTMVNLLK
ncbi:HDOD domain-containing protein [Marinomonas sp. 15G1-11]|uniref:HDOD domain-containing protein n=1 Tax=Marinomonas phaeophyticola TaxID=3004091 RepID=A0ABT4JWD4_9GAMM|nr:HDOD domain-containing protein [Marinomonas sp. 15G1-11]MCZ2722677.1 HDOD domain-containing protein [Marinomonas sp. 15G1-11]